MHINVRDLLIESVGYRQDYHISGERPQLGAVSLVQDIEGDITITRLDAGLAVQGQLQTAIQLECHRCLSAFTRPAVIKVSQEFAESPGDDQLPISDDSIDLAPLIEQEIILGLPIKLLCKPDCPGIEGAAGKYTKDDAPGRLQDRARITKGTKRGRT